jgi:hypothetical protein
MDVAPMKGHSCKKYRSGRHFVRASISCAVLPFVLMLSICCTEASPGRNDNGEVVFEKFKQFIENPPEDLDVIFSYDGPPQSRFDTNLNRWERKAAQTAFVRAQCGQDYLINVWSSTRKGAETPLFPDLGTGKILKAFVRSGDNFWDIGGEPNQVTYWKGPLKRPLDLSNPVVLSHFIDTLPVFALINMGPHFLVPGSVQWSGDQFKRKTGLFKDDITIEGRLYRGANGFPERMLLSYRGKSIDGRYAVRYEFTNSPSVPDFIPSRILSTVFDGKKELPDKDIRILSFSLNTSIDPSSATRAWIAANHPRLFIYTNGLT